MALNHEAVIDVRCVGAGKHVVGADALDLAEELVAHNRHKVRSPAQLLLFANRRTLEDGGWVGHEVIDEVHHRVVKAALVDLVFNDLAHATGCLLGFLAQTQQRHVMHFGHALAERFGVQLSTLLDVGLGFIAHEVHDGQANLGRQLGFFGRLEIERAVVLQDHVLNPGLGRAALHVRNHHEDVGAASLLNLDSLVGVVLAPALTLTLEQALSDLLLGELCLVPATGDVARDAGRQKVGVIHAFGFFGAHVRLDRRHCLVHRCHQKTSQVQPLLEDCLTVLTRTVLPPSRAPKQRYCKASWGWLNLSLTGRSRYRSPATFRRS